MNAAPSSDGIALYGYALSAALHAALALYLLLSSRLKGQDRLSGRALVAALCITAVWAGSSALAELQPRAHWRDFAAAADLARYALWFGFLLQLLRSGADGTQALATPQALHFLRIGAIGAVVLSAVLLVLESQAQGPLGLPPEPNRWLLVAALVLALLGMLAVEQLFRNVGDDARWGAKPLCLGLVCIFAFDIYLYSESLLFNRIDPDATNLRGAVHALAVPFLWVAARRRGDWVRRLQVSRTAAFYSATLILAGAYLLFMSAVGYYVRFFGGTWGRALQLGLLAGGLAMLGALLFSGSLRAWIKVFVGKHFYSYRYDYREEWLRFTAMLSSKRSPQETGGMIVRGLAKMVECPAGSLWTRASLDAPYTEASSWNMPSTGGTEAATSAFCALLRDKGWVIDLEEFRSAPKRYGDMVMPAWLLASPSPWLVVPLLVDNDMLGFVVLARPRTAMELNWEVLDLLKTAGRQAAGYLAQMQATEALLEARKFEAFNRMSAFVVHDLKNIVTQLSLMLKNAERLHDNREFQQDMLLTVESSLEKMRRLMLQLREGATPVGGGRGVELLPIVARLEALAAGQGRKLEVVKADKLSTRGHDDRLERVLGHLVQNALDATPPNGRVWLTAERASGQIKVDVGDTGAGMTEDFIQTRLFRPFNTTKHSGMGIGTYESFQYIRELGGSISATSSTSEPGQGTVMTVLLPIFEAQSGSDLLRTASPSANTP
jgi:putative PEP-CTERM system histidine kinase